MDRNAARTFPLLLMLLACAALLPACTPVDAANEPRPQQSGAPMNRAQTAARMLRLQAAAVTGDEDGVKRQLELMHKDMMRSMKVSDTTRKINPESARATVRALPGVRSVAWVDRENLLVRVNDAASRSQRGIDRICLALEPLGDTLAVVVHVQDASARTGSALDTLSRNCQLQPGEHAFLQPDRRMDVLEPEARAQYHAGRERRQQQAGSRPMSAGDRAALDAIPQM